MEKVMYLMILLLFTDIIDIINGDHGKNYSFNDFVSLHL